MQPRRSALALPPQDRLPLVFADGDCATPPHLRIALALGVALLAAACGWNPRDLVASAVAPLPEPAPIDGAGGPHGALIGGETTPMPRWRVR